MLVERVPRPRMHREDEAALRGVDRVDDRAQPVRLGVRLAVDRQHRVGRLVAAARSRRATGSKSRVASRHHVADHLPAAGDALRLELRRRALVGTEEQRRQPVDLDPVPLLGHRQVEAAQPRLDVRDRHLLARGVRSGERRVRVAVDEHPVGPLRLDHLADRRGHRHRVGGAQVEPVRRLREAELVEEDLRHLGVPVLPRVQHDLVDPRLAERHRERRRLDELGPVPDDGEDFRTARYDTRRFPGR